MTTTAKPSIVLQHGTRLWKFDEFGCYFGVIFELSGTRAPVPVAICAPALTDGSVDASNVGEVEQWESWEMYDSVQKFFRVDFVAGYCPKVEPTPK